MAKPWHSVIIIISEEPQSLAFGGYMDLFMSCFRAGEEDA